MRAQEPWEAGTAKGDPGMASTGGVQRRRIGGGPGSKVDIDRRA